MNWMLQLLRRLKYLRNRQQMDADLAEEMRLHLELKANRETASGASPGDARASAQREFGNVTRLKEKSRDAWGWGWLDSLAQDLRYGWRNLISARGFTITAILSLALGIGANTAVFSIMNALMLRLLPVREPQQLVSVGLGENGPFSNPLWEELRDQQNTFTDTLAYATTQFDLAEQGERRPAQGLTVSGDFFKTLGVDPWLGRLLNREDDRPGGNGGPAAVISHQFWKSEFGSDPSVIGKKIRLNRIPFEIVGVTPPSFAGLDVDSQFSVAVPIGIEEVFHPGQSSLKERSMWVYRVVGRLQPGLTAKDAEARLGAVTKGILEGALPPWGPDGEREFMKHKFAIKPASTGFNGIGSDGRTALYAMMGVVALVLLIACANIANLLLARAAARQQEISVRMAIGAGRARLIRQLLTESILLSALGIPGGLLLAKWGSGALLQMFSNPRHPLTLDLSLDTNVILFTTGITLLTGVLFGLAPAFRGTRVAPSEAMKQNARTASSGKFRLGKGLVAAQVALSLALLVAAGLFLGTMRNLLNVSLGFNQKNVLSIALDGAGHVPADQRAATFADIVEQVKRVPGVTSAGTTAIQPISGGGWNGDLLMEGEKPIRKRDGRSRETWFNRLSPGYFQTMHTPILMGRDFKETDTLSSPKVIIISESLAKEYFGNESPVGKILSAQYGPGDPVRVEVIGVVGDTKYLRVREETRRTAFVPLAQEAAPWPRMTLMVRSESPLPSLIPSVRDAITKSHPEVSMQISVLDLQVRETLRTQRTIAILSTFFGVIAVLLALVGLYGVTSYAVTQRRGEIGLRMALGAQRGSVVWLILRDVAVVLAIGSAIGIGLSIGAGKLIGSLMFGIQPTDPFVLISAALILAGAGGLAGLLPAMRASKLDPALALRCE